MARGAKGELELWKERRVPMWTGPVLLALAAVVVGATGATGLSGRQLEQPTLAFTLTEGGGQPFGSVDDVQFLAGDRTAVLDGQARVIYVFASDGSLDFTLGGEGQGPTEIGGAQNLAVDADGNLVVLDFTNLRLNRWTSTGVHLGTVPVRDLVPSGYFPLGLSAGQGHLFLRSTGFRPEDGLALSRVLPGGDGAEVAFEWKDGEPGCTFCAWLPIPGGFAMAQGDTLYRVHRIAVDGSHTLGWSRDDLPAMRRDPAERARMNQMAGQRLAAEGGSGATQSGFEWLPRFGASAGTMALDANGDLWLVPGTPPDREGQVDVFSQRGGLLGSLHLPHLIRGVTLGDDRIAVRSETPAGEPAVMIYRRR